MDMNRKNIALWTLYDFANSIVVVVFFLYFSQWLVVDKGVSDFWYNMTFALGSVLLLLTAPVLGAMADKTGRQQSYLNKITVLTFIFFVLTSLAALFWSRQVWIAALFFLIANYLYQFSFVFYNALLSYIAPREKWGSVSGVGQAGNWLGQIAGLVITLPLASGAVYLIGEAGRAQTFLPATIIFFILALPMLLFFKFPNLSRPPATLSSSGEGKIDWKGEYKLQWHLLRQLLRAPSMGYFLLAYFFFNDAIITAANNFPIFLENVFGVSDNVKSMLFAGILVTSAIGALISGRVADKLGLKKTLMIVLGIWIVVFPAVGLIQSFPVFVGFCVIMGFMFGAVWTVTRAAMTALCPPDQLNFGFSFYTLAERVSTFAGPLAWGAITGLLFPLGPLRYRIAMVAMAVFVAFGIWVLRKVEIDEYKVVL